MNRKLSRSPDSYIVPTCLNFLFPSVSLISTPLLSSLETSLGWTINQQRLAISILILLSVAVGLLFRELLKILRSDGQRRVLETFYFGGWLVVISMFFATHISNIRFIGIYGLGVGLLLAAVYYNQLLRVRPFVFYIALSFVVVDSVKAINTGYIELPQYSVQRDKAAPTKDSKKLHIILDAFGYETSFPDKLEFEKFAQAFGEKHGLTFYKNHFSSASYTNVSVPDFMRVDRTIPPVNSYLTPTENVLFKELYNEGFEINIHSQGMPYCLRFYGFTNTCISKAGFESGLSLEVKQMFALYLSEVHMGLASLVFGQSIFDYIYHHPYSSKVMLDEFRNSIAPKEGPRYWLVHSLVSHEPYNLDSECELVSERQNAGVTGQIKCSMKSVDLLFDRLKQLGMFDDMQIVIHSDHGFNLKGVSAEEYSEVTTQDVIESGHIPTWTKSPKQKVSITVEYLTSNDDVADFLLNDLDVLPARKRVIYRWENPNFRKVHVFESDDGVEWAQAKVE